MISSKLAICALACVTVGTLAAPTNTGGAFGDETTSYYSPGADRRVVCYVSHADRERLDAKIGSLSSFKRGKYNIYPVWSPHAYPADAGENVFISLCQLYNGNSEIRPISDAIRMGATGL